MAGFPPAEVASFRYHLGQAERLIRRPLLGLRESIHARKLGKSRAEDCKIDSEKNSTRVVPEDRSASPHPHNQLLLSLCRICQRDTVFRGY
jgi:hypothetical protein